MPSLIFVHGTGVRRSGYDSAFQTVREALSGRRDLVVEPCYWGDLGSSPVVASVPGAGRAEKTEPYAVVLWGLLYDDPIYELRVLALRQRREKTPLGQLPAGQALANRAIGYRNPPEVLEELGRAGLDQYFEPAHRRVVDDPVFLQALTSATEPLAEYRAAIASAWTAEAIRRRQAAGPDLPWISATRRDGIVSSLIEELGGEELAFSDWARKRVLAVGTRLVRRNRQEITSAGSPIAGDILLYQARGGPIRERIRTAITRASPPVVLVAHSLGGVASVDLLVGEELPVDLLVTVGSQAPFFYEIGALAGLEAGTGLPEHFPRWLNVFDLRDFLSFVGEQVFPGQVTDIEVDNGQPFPASHGAYWNNDEVWIAVAREMA